MNFFVVEGEKIRIDKRGRWFSNGIEISHQKTCTAFSRSVSFDKELKQYYIHIGYERIYIETEGTPYFVVQINEEKNNLIATLSTGEKIPVQPNSLTYQEASESELFLKLENEEVARFLFQPHHELIAQFEPVSTNSNKFILKKFGITLMMSLLLINLSFAKKVTPEERKAIIARAKVFQSVNISRMNTLEGPKDSNSYAFKENVSCTYLENDPNDPITGFSKKFRCLNDKQKRLKIKYDPFNNTEVFGEIAATRLFWSLGYFAEKMYSVIVSCDNCPKDPFVSDKPPRGTFIFDPATVQNKIKGESIYAYDPNDGWGFKDLELVDSNAGGSTKAEVDAFKLLNAFVYNGDNDMNQNKILCLENDSECKKPILLVHDLGGTFGNENGYYTKFIHWRSVKDIWKDPGQCLVNFSGMAQGSQFPKISEEGRALFADQLSQLSETQIAGYFQAGRFDVLNEIDEPFVDDHGVLRRPTINDWVAVFKDKANQIIKHKCQ